MEYNEKMRTGIRTKKYTVNTGPLVGYGYPQVRPEDIVPQPSFDYVCDCEAGRDLRQGRDDAGIVC